MTNPEVMTVKELAEFLRLPVSSVYRLVRDGTIPGIKLGMMDHVQTLIDFPPTQKPSSLSIEKLVEASLKNHTAD